MVWSIVGCIQFQLARAWAKSCQASQPAVSQWMEYIQWSTTKIHTNPFIFLKQGICTVMILYCCAQTKPGSTSYRLEFTICLECVQIRNVHINVFRCGFICWTLSWRFLLAVSLMTKSWKYSLCAAIHPWWSQGLYSLSGKMSYHKISRSFEAARFGFSHHQTLWQLAGSSAVGLSRCMSNFRAMRSLLHPILRLRDFTRFVGKTSHRLVNRGHDYAINDLIQRYLPVNIYVDCDISSSKSWIIVIHHYTNLTAKSGRPKDYMTCYKNIYKIMLYILWMGEIISISTYT